MNAVVAILAVALAWVGAGILVLSDGRRGVAAGMLVSGAGLALGQFAASDPVPAGLVAAGAGLAALASLRGIDASGWRFLPPGTTPRIVLTLVLGGVALWFGAAVLEGPGEWQMRGAAALVIALAGARALTVGEVGVSLAAASLVALASAGLAGQRPAGSPAALLAVVAAVGLSLVPWLFGRNRVREILAADA